MASKQNDVLYHFRSGINRMTLFNPLPFFMCSKVSVVLLNDFPHIQCVCPYMSCTNGVLVCLA